MSTFFRFNGLATRILALPLALLCTAGFFPAAKAQTAPQLLPYVPKVLAGGGVALTTGQACPDATHNKSLDAYGDGCLATSVLLSSPRYAVTDSLGNVFFSDYTSAVSLIRRIDVATGIVTAVGGGKSTSPAAGPCPTTGYTSVDAKGDGCLATDVNLFNPESMKFAANGDLYFVENGNQDVRKITATNGFITTTGVISLVAGNVGKVSGYAVDQGGTPIVPGPGSTTSMLDFPADIAFDKAGNIYIADEGNNALEVINTTATTQTIQNVSVAAGTIAKIAGYGVAQTKSATGECPNGQFVSTTNRGGCYFGTFSATNPSVAVTANLDAPYGIVLDSAGNVIFTNEFIEGVGKISNGTLTNYAGTNGTGALYSASKPFPRGTAGTFPIGSDFGIGIDNQDNTYITDALNGVIWRVDKAGPMYVIAGGSFTPPVAHTACPGASNYTSSDAFGDGCPATSAVFGKSGTSFASTTAPGPGVYGVSVDAYSNLYVGDTEEALIREVGNGTSLGTATSSTVIVHLVSGDSIAANGEVVSTNPSLFTLTPGTCVPNADGTSDCPLTITGTASVVGPYSGAITITSVKGGSSIYPVNGIFAPTPVTSLSVSASVGTACAGATKISSGSPVTLNASVTAVGTPTGTIQFYANNVPVGPPQPVSRTQSTFVYSPTSTGPYTITAAYSGDGYYQASTGAAPTGADSTNFTVASPSFTVTATPYTQSTVVAGQTALYSLAINQTVYTGTISFACSGLPANASCVFSPTSITATGCSTTSTVALSILTQQAGPLQASLAGSGRGPWQAITLLPGIFMALWIGIRRRKSPLRFGQVWLALALLLVATGVTACGKSGNTTLATPTGTSTVTVTFSGSAGTVTTLTVPLTVK